MAGDVGQTAAQETSGSQKEKWRDRPKHYFSVCGKNVVRMCFYTTFGGWGSAAKGARYLGHSYNTPYVSYRDYYYYHTHYLIIHTNSKFTLRKITLAVR